MCPPSKIQPTVVGPALQDISRTNRPELSCYSPQNELSNASRESNASINIPQRIGSLQMYKVSPSNKIRAPLSMENPAPGESQVNPVPVSTPSSNLFILDGELDFSYGRLSPMVSNGILAESPPTNHRTVTVQLDEGSPAEFEWHDLMAFLDAEKEKMRALHSMSTMERFLTYDRNESPLVVEPRRGR